MFTIEPQYKTTSNIAEIYRGFQSLLFIDEPLVYTGINAYNGRILGSLMDVDEETQKRRFIHALIDDNSYSDYVNQKISYSDVLSSTNNIYILDYPALEGECEIYSIDLEDIPLSYLPTTESFCPLIEELNSQTFALELKGKLAEHNRAFPKVVSVLQNTFSDIIESIASCTGLRGGAKTQILPYEMGSFNLKLQVDLSDLLPVFQDQIAVFSNEYLRYILNHWEKDVGAASQFVDITSTDFQSLLKTFLQVKQTELEDDDVEQLKDNLKSNTDKVMKISDVIGSGFEEINFYNIGADNQQNVIGRIDSVSSEALQVIVNKLDEMTSDVTVDTKPQQYEVLIYHLNTDTRKGNAHIKESEDSKKYLKPAIKILGDEPLEGSDFTASLHENKMIQIYGKARKSDGKIRSIEIEFEKK